MMRYFLLGLCLCAACCRTDQVVAVIDGDTFKTERGATIRLLGINAPEIGEPGADIAKELLVLLVFDKPVRLVRDVSDQDDYGRLLRYVYQGDRFINAEIVRLGCAETRCYPPDTLFKGQLEETERTALRNRRGLWAFSVFQMPDTTGILLVKDVEPTAISWQEAAKFYNQTKVVEGKIVASNNTGKVCFLNFDKDWKRYFTAVIFAGDFNKFPAHPEDYYLNRRVRVRGLIKEYKGKPEIILKSPAQIEVIE
jgi:micrococcal nuclease